MSEVIVSAETIRKLLAAGNGDSALLYLCRAAELSDVATGFTEARLECAAALLRQLGLDGSRNPRFQQSAQHPEYTEQDIRRQLETPGTGFKLFVGEVQRCMGRALSSEELKSLLTMREYLCLPVEVLNVLIHYCVDRGRSRGAGRMPSMRMIEKEAYHWADLQIDTLEKAAAYIQRETAKTRVKVSFAVCSALPGGASHPRRSAICKLGRTWAFPTTPSALPMKRPVRTPAA